GTGPSQHLDLPGAQIGGRVGFRALLQHAQHDLCAGCLSEARQFVQRALGLERAGVSGDQTDERGALASGYARGPLCSVSSHVSISSQAIAPALISVGGVVVTSTIVDAGPPGAGPVSSRKSIRSPNTRSTSSGSAVDWFRLTFALVAVTG